MLDLMHTEPWKMQCQTTLANIDAAHYITVGTLFASYHNHLQSQLSPATVHNLHDLPLDLHSHLPDSSFACSPVEYCYTGTRHTPLLAENIFVHAGLPSHA